MILGDYVKTLPAGYRVRIRSAENTDEEGAPDYSPALTDAQLLAWQSARISGSYLEPDRQTAYCTIVSAKRSGKGAKR